MKAHSIKTDNANVSHKVQLRKEATENLETIRVLDLFAGNNVLWSYFDCEKYYGVEVVKCKGKNLNADNIRVIESLDLSRFNVIDCDSYGIPLKQIEEIYKNPTLQDGTIIIYTAIGNSLSALSKVVLKSFGISSMYKKCKVLFNSKAHDFFYGYLYELGVRKVREYQEESPHFSKKYGYFKVKKN